MQDLPSGLKSAVERMSAKIKQVFGYSLPAGVEWRTSDHPDYEKDRMAEKEFAGDRGGFITKDWKKIYLMSEELEKTGETLDDFVSHEIGHFLDRDLGDGNLLFSSKIDLPPTKHGPMEAFAEMVNFVAVDGHSGGPAQTILYNAVCDKLGIKDRVKKTSFDSKIADYPDHPDDIVITKRDSLSGDVVREIDVWNYYTGDVVTEMLKELRGRNLFIAIRLKGQTGKPLYIRHPYDKKTEYIRISSKGDFEHYRSGRTVEYHVTMPANCPYYVVDFDGMPSGDFGKTKKIAAEVSDELDKLSEVKKVEIRYTGKRGFHILGWLKKEKPVDKAREDLKAWLNEKFGDHDDVVVAESAKGSKGALGVSPMKLNGGQVALWSLRVTGLCCVEVPRSKLMSFKKEDASLDKVYKKLTGKTFVWEKIKKAYLPITDLLRAITAALQTSTPQVLQGIEIPCHKAVKALINDKPIRAGWNPDSATWSILLDSTASEGVKKAAKETGLVAVSVHRSTCIYLPDVDKGMTELATSKFDKFAELYEKHNKEVSSVLSSHINQDAVVVRTIKTARMKTASSEKTWRQIQNEYEQKYGKNHHCLRLECTKCENTQTCRCSTPKTTERGICYYCTGEIEREEPLFEIKTAGYDRDLYKPGYKGRFVISDHDAEKAGKHFDLRIEMPVTSLKKALEKHSKKSEETKEYPDKPGTVYRSWAVRKHTIPTSKRKLFIVETEDHSIADGNFTGKIPEGQYGAGTVSIYDKGRYELISVEGDKKYVFDFQGRKLHGQYALVKYSNGYLWVKVREKTASVVDYVHPTLNKSVWDTEGKPPMLRPHIRQILINTLMKSLGVFKNPEIWVKGAYFTGSLSSYNYTDDSDLDVDVDVDFNIFKEHNKNIPDEKIYGTVKEALYKHNDEVIGNTTHTFSYLLLKGEDISTTDSMYDVFNNRWIKGPPPIPPSFDPDKAFLRQRQKAEAIAQEIDLVIGRIKRVINDLKAVDAFQKTETGLDSRRILYLYQLKRLCLDLNDWHTAVRGLQKVKFDCPESKLYYPSFDFGANWEECSVILKYLTRMGYNYPVRLIYEELEGDPYLKIVDKFIPD